MPFLNIFSAQNLRASRSPSRKAAEFKSGSRVRVTGLGATSIVALILALSATPAMAVDVANQTDWNTAVAAVAAAGAGSSVAINITSSFTLSSSLAQLQASNANVVVNITGNSNAINGASAFQGIQVNGANALAVNISNLAVNNTAAMGGAGGAGQNGFFSGGLSYGSGGGGGGGLGAGGALYVGSGAKVSIASVTFTGNSATGGTGGNGGVAQNTASSPTGGNGGEGGALNGSGAVGGGGAGGLGGNTGTQGTVGTAGATPGAGGGGGGGSGTTSSTAYTPNNNGGAGSVGGGNGAQGGDGVTNNNGSQGPGTDGGSGGNGGSGQGGAVYVATGGTLTILDTAISGATVAGGAGGSQGVGQGPSSFSGSPGGTGAAAGAGIFLSTVAANIGVSSGTVTYANTIGGTGLTTGGINTAINKTGVGTLVLSATNTFVGNVNISGGTLSIAGTANLGNAVNGVVMSDGTTLAVTATSTLAPARAFKIAGTSTLDIASGTTTTLQGVISDGASAGSLSKSGDGTLLLSAANTYTGATVVNGGTLRMGNASAIPAGTALTVNGILDLNNFNLSSASLSGTSATGGITLGTATLTTGTNNADSTFAGVISGAGGLTKSGTGALTLSGTNTYTGATVINSGLLNVDGSIASSSSLIIGAAATLGGSGALPSTTINGILSPGHSPGTLTFNGNLTLGAGSTYIAQVEGAVSDRVNVNGTASLAGTLQLTPLGGAYTFNSPYTLLSATGGRTGTFGAINTAGTFGAGVTSTVGYTATDVQLTLVPAPLAPIVAPTPTPTPTPAGPALLGLGQPTNVFNVATAIDRAVANGANATPFFNVYNQPAAALPAAVNMLSGEVHSAVNAMSVEVSDQFLRTMLDPFAVGRGTPAGTAPTSPYSVWGSVLGHRGRTNGDPTGTGSATRETDSFGFATGADYRISPQTLVGFALAGGGANTSLANGQGSANAGVFQAGVYGMTRFGDLELGVSGAYTHLDADTKRTVPVLQSGSLTSSYQTNGFSGRVEGSYRVATLGGISISPFSAFQVQSIDQPSFNEHGGVTGSLGSLTARSRTNLTTRGELGLKLETDAVVGGYQTRGFVRAGWSQYFTREMGFGASIDGLPGSNFVIDGAKPNHSSLRLATGIDVKVRENVSINARFDGDFAGNSVQYGGNIGLKVGF